MELLFTSIPCVFVQCTRMVADDMGGSADSAGNSACVEFSSGSCVSLGLSGW